MELAPGLRACVQIVVADADTAAALGSGDVPVLATPRLLALAEAAAVAAIKATMQPELTSVGTSVVIEHTRASPIGAEVMVEAELTEVDGRRLVFSFIATQGRPMTLNDEAIVVATGTVERAIVNRERFIERAEHRGGQ
jgi:predicted thioesterase